MAPADETGEKSADESQEDAPTLGYSAAVKIVCDCANADRHNLSRTLGELGVDGVSFKGMVFNAISDAGYTIDIDSIPNASTSTLLSVVGVIENAKPA
jgi:hypothetical protein